MDRFAKIDNYLADDMWAKLLEFFEENVRWGYGWQSNQGGKTPLAHLNHDFLGVHRSQSGRLLGGTGSQSEERHPESPVAEAPGRLPARALACPLLCQCAHVYGIEGDIHVDSLHAGNYTTIFYVVPQWQPDWAGETVILNDLGDIVHAVIPRPNRAIVFDGRLQHAARAVHRKYAAGLRVTLHVQVSSGRSSR